MERITYFFLVIYLTFSALGLLLIKSGSGNFALNLNQNTLNLTLSLKMILGAIFYILSFLFFIFLIPKFNLSFIYPLATGVLYITIILTSYFILGEKLSLIQMVSTLLILSGIIGLNINSK